MSQRWTGSYFQRSSLQKAGLRVQLGHPPGQYCTMRSAVRNDFTVIHSNGIHSVSVDVCGCSNVKMHIQLLRVGWWPATPLDPNSCATFQVLREFQTLNLQGKVPIYDYYRTLELLTDNTGLESLPVRTRLFIP
jgi:hypothetical protein